MRTFSSGMNILRISDTACSSSQFMCKIFRAKDDTPLVINIGSVCEWKAWYSLEITAAPWQKTDDREPSKRWLRTPNLVNLSVYITSCVLLS